LSEPGFVGLMGLWGEDVLLQQTTVPVFSPTQVTVRFFSENYAMTVCTQMAFPPGRACPA